MDLAISTALGSILKRNQGVVYDELNTGTVDRMRHDGCERAALKGRGNVRVPVLRFPLQSEKQRARL